jgi:hypothetical protein
MFPSEFDYVAVRLANPTKLVDLNRVESRHTFERSNGHLRVSALSAISEASQ